MGLEADCEVRHGRRTSKGRAQLETAELLFRGGFALKIPFKDIRSSAARKGALHVRWPGGDAVFLLGAAAEKWALKIRHPRGLMDKLGVKADSRVSVLRLDDASILAEMRGRTPRVTEGRAAMGSDVVLALMEAKADLTEGIHPDVVQLPSHWAARQNVNTVMDNVHCAPSVGSTQLRGQLCRVKKKA